MSSFKKKTTFPGVKGQQFIFYLNQRLIKKKWSTHIIAQDEGINGNLRRDVILRKRERDA